MNNQSKRVQFDIIIIGGGMVGACTALALAKLPLKIALIEALELKVETSPSFDQRAVALSASSVEILKTLGLWQAIKDLACPIEKIHISNKGHFGFTHLLAKDHQVEALGQVIPLDQTGPKLWQAMQASDNIQLFCPYQLEKILQPDESQANTQDLMIRGAQDQLVTLSAQLIIAADGTLSAVAKQLQMPVVQKAYHQQAIIANVSTQVAHQNQAFERFTKQGPIALLPLTRNRMSLVWCVASDQWQALMDCDSTEFLTKLQQQFGYRLGKFTKVGQRASYPLSLRYAEKIYKNRVMLLGNAARTLHPIAGQGFNLALRDVAALFDYIAAQQMTDICLGDSIFLQGLVKKRQADWQQTQTVTDGLVRIFSNDFLPFIVARNQALFLFDHLPFAKNILAQNAMGFAGESSTLARGLKPQAKLPNVEANSP